MARTGVNEIVFHDLFWDTLRPHRDHAYYPSLRKKLIAFLLRKQDSTAPVNRRDGNFSGIAALKGVWHFAIQRNPDVVIFYTLDGDRLHLAMVGSHHDYPHDGKHYAAAARTAGRIWNAVERPGVNSPLWEGGIRWSSPSDLLTHPDVPELSPAALRQLMREIEEETESAPRFRLRTGADLLEAEEQVFEAYFQDISTAQKHLELVHDARLGALFFVKNAHILEEERLGI